MGGCPSVTRETRIISPWLKENMGERNMRYAE